MTNKEKLNLALAALIGLLLGVSGALLVDKLAGSGEFGGEAGNQNIEEYDPYVRYNAGIRTALGINASSTLAVSGASTFTSTLTVTGTTTITESVDGHVVGGTISTAATGTVRTVYTNTTGPKMCDADTGYLLVQSNSTFAPATVWSFGTSTSAANASTNLIASSTVATSTQGTQSLGIVTLTANRLFRLGAGETLTAIMGDHLTTSASSTNFSNLTAEAGVWCQDLSI